MSDILSTTLPDSALLRRYSEDHSCYTDCFSTLYPAPIGLPEFVEAFYTAPLFRCERVILKLCVRRPSTDQQAAEVAQGRIQRFAAWDVEDRADNQLLMCDMASRTRSWFMCVPEQEKTRLYFGSAVTPAKGAQELGFMFRVLHPLHELYSRALLTGATRRLSLDLGQTAAR